MKRVGRLVPGLAAALVLLTAAQAATGAVRIKRVDLSGYPTVRVSVLTPTVRTPAPTLRENGKAVTGLTASRLHSKSVVIAVDRSRSMRGAAIRNATAAARRFVAAKEDADRFALFGVGSEALQLTSFGTATIDVDSGLRSLSVDSAQGTALYDTIVLASLELQKQPRPRLLLLITDGRDRGSSASLADAIDGASRAGVAVYSIGVDGPQLTPAPLRALARATGGTYFAGRRSALLTRAYERLSAELRRTWDLQYFTTARPGDHLRISTRWHGIVAGTRLTIPKSEAAASGGGRGFLERTRDHWWAAVIIGLLAGLLVFYCIGLLIVTPRKQWVRERLRPWTNWEALPAVRTDEYGRLAPFAPLFRATERMLEGRGPWRRLERALERADLQLRAVELFYLMVTSGFALGVIAAVAGFGLYVTVLFVAIGALAPYLAVYRKGSKRLSAFDAQLPSALNTLAGSLKAGHSFTQALQVLVEEAGPPMDGELRRVMTETRLGRSMDTSLMEMGRRVGSKELNLVLRAVIVQRQVGGSMAGLFELVADTLVQRQQFHQKVKALTAQGRMTAVLLIALPFMIGFLLSLVSPGYLNPLFHSGTGQVLTTTAILMMTFGALMLRKITSFRGYR